MGEAGPFTSIQELLAHPTVKQADALELSICDIVHFRLVEAEAIFQLTELHLQKRDKDFYEGFAEIRGEVESTMRGSSVFDKISACCTKRPEWLEDRQILYSMELEVWMDMSYPNPWALQLYHEALKQDLAITVPLIGPFTETFHTLLKEKNGYELTTPAPDSNKVVKVFIGEQAYPKETGLQLNTKRRVRRLDPFAGDGHLGCRLAHGILEKDLEDNSAKEMNEAGFEEHSVGYRLIGPTLLLLIQFLSKRTRPVSFHGPGRQFLADMVESLRPHWPWLPETEALAENGNRFSIFHAENGSISLLPEPGANSRHCILEWVFDDPTEILLPGVEWIMNGCFNGPSAEGLQSSAAAFIRDYAQLSRGLNLPMAVPPVLRNWCHYLLAPEPAFLVWAAAPGRFKGFRRSRTPWHLHRQLHRGPWPTGSYLLSNGFSRWMALRSDKRVPELVEAGSRYA